MSTTPRRPEHLRAPQGEKLPEHAQHCPNCGGEPDQPDVHVAGCPRLDSVLQYGPPWLPLPSTLQRR